MQIKINSKNYKLRIVYLVFLYLECLSSFFCNMRGVEKTTTEGTTMGDQNQFQERKKRQEIIDITKVVRHWTMVSFHIRLF